MHQTDTKVSAFKKAMEKSGRDDDYDVPSVIRNETWNAYIRSPFEGVARRAFVQTITFPCIDDTKLSDMTPPYRITCESVTTDLGTVTSDSQIIPVTMFLVMLYNACFMFQNNNETNLLTTALDTLDLNADIDHDKFMTTTSEYNNLRQIMLRIEEGIMSCLSISYIHGLGMKLSKFYSNMD